MPALTLFTLPLGSDQQEPRMPRQNTRLEAEGAEFLVLGHLLVEGMQAYKMYTNMPGYDVMVVNPDTKVVARISVKSRWRVGAEGFIIKNLDSDFVVVVKLNRSKVDLGAVEAKPPEFFVIPTDDIRALHRSGWGKIAFSKIPHFQSYLGGWDRIRQYMGVAMPSEPTDEDAGDAG
jgi:hypothetical protein